MYKNKREMPIMDARMIAQTLQAAASMADEHSVMFPLRAKRVTPTAAQAAFAREVIYNYLNNDIIDEADLPYLATVLSYMQFELETLARYNVGDAQDPLDYIARTHGILWTETFSKTLLKYSRLFSGCEQVDAEEPYQVTMSLTELNDLLDILDYVKGLWSGKHAIGSLPTIQSIKNITDIFTLIAAQEESKGATRAVIRICD